MGLKQELEKFNQLNSNLNLDAKFEELAKEFLYGGYFNVNNKYHIYIRTVEFYFHAEDDSVFKDDNYKDPIVYHRNNKYVKGEVPYFPTMALHAHASGIDVTFENETLKYRASALIRAYEVCKVSKDDYNIEKQFLVYCTTDKKFIPWKEGMKNKYNTQSTYLYNFLNGFDNDSINWIDNEPIETSNITKKERQNVYISHSEDKLNVYKINKGEKKEKDERPWSFTREDDIELKQ